MSTKIYTAYRLKQGVEPFAWAARARKRGQFEVQKALTDFYGHLMSKTEDMDEHAASMAFRKGALEIPDPLSVCICIWKLRSRYYLIPYAQEIFRNTLNFLAKDRALEDFSYWNNTDAPEGVSRAEWQRRGRIWDEILDVYKGEGQWDRLLVEIFSKGNFWRIDPARAMIKKRLRRVERKREGSPPKKA